MAVGKCNPTKGCGLMRAALFIALIILALGITGNGDYEAELARGDHYCQLVRSNVWPDFNPEIDCEE